MRPDVPSEQGPRDEGNVVDPAVFQQRRIGHTGPESLLARASAAERAVVALESRLQEIERELSATALQRDELAVELREHHAGQPAVEPPAETAPAVSSQERPVVRSLAERVGDRLRDVDDALIELGSRLHEERLAREAAEAALATHRAAHEQQVVALRETLVSDAEHTRARLREIETELQQLGKSTAELEQDRDMARAELLNVDQQLGETRTALETARQAQTEAESNATAERQARERAEAQLAEERATFSQQLQIADGQLRAEIETQRQAFEEHTAAVQRSIAVLHQQLADARAAAQREATPPIDSLKAGLEQAAARLRELAPDRPDDDPPVQEVADDTPRDQPAEPTDIDNRADELAQAIEEASAQSASQPEPVPLPRREIPSEKADAWMAPAFERLYAQEPETAARVVVDLLPSVAADLGRDALLDFVIDELGAYRLTAHMGIGSISSWQTSASKKADLALAGSALALAPFAIGGAGRRRPRGVEVSGKRRALWRLLRIRREPVTLADIGGAQVVPGLGNLLALLAANVGPDWVGDNQLAIGFSTIGSGAGTWVVRTDEEGNLKVTPCLTSADAVITVPPEAIVALFAGDEIPITSQPTVAGDASKALLLLGWFDRVQRSQSPSSS